MNQLEREDRLSLVAVGLVAAALLGKVVLTHYLTLGFPGEPLGIAADLLFTALLVGSVLLVPSPRLRLLALWVVDIAMSALLVTSAIYAEYFGGLWTPGLLRLAPQAIKVMDSAFELMEWVHLLYAVDLLLLALITILMFSRPRDARRTAGARTRRLIALAALIALIGVWILPLRAATLEFDPTRDIWIAARYGLLAFQGASIAAANSSKAAQSAAPKSEDPRVPIDEEIRSIVGADAGRRSELVPSGVAQGKNVIVVQVEALQSFVIGRHVQGVEVTPNLDRLARESWYFPDAVGGAGRGSTADAEFISNTSFYPSTMGESPYVYQFKKLPSLPRTLAARGIDSYTFHTNDVHFWNRHMLYPGLGFTGYYDKQFFGDGDKIALGASDDVLFKRTLKELRALSDGGAPFYAQIITMSSHHPFDPLPRRKNPFVPRGVYKHTEVGGYISNVHYADEALGEFIRELKRTGLYDQSVLIVYGDHYGLTISGEDSAEAKAERQLLGRNYNEVDMAMVPLFVHIPGDNAGHRVEDVVGQIDVMPTITDLLGIKTGDMVQFGHSVFVTKAKTPVYPIIKPLQIGSFADNTAVVMENSVDNTITVRSIRGSEELLPPTSQQARRVKDARRLVELSEKYAGELPLR